MNNVIMQNNCSWIGIGIELSPLLTQECSKLNLEISKIYPDSNKFTQTNRPHLNLYDLDVPKDNISDITSFLRNALENVTSFGVQILGIKYFNFGAIFFEVEKHPLLLDLHSTIVSTVSKYKGNCVCKDYLQSWRNYTQKQEEMLKKYGNPYVMNEFHPHISLGFIKTSEEVFKAHIEYLNKIVKIDSFRIEELSLVDDVKNGHNTLATFNLK